VKANNNPNNGILKHETCMTYSKVLS